MNDYVMDSCAWSFIGLVAGYSLAKAEVGIRSLIIHVTPRHKSRRHL